MGREIITKNGNGIRNINSMTLKGIRAIEEIKNSDPIFIDLESSGLCLNCDVIHNGKGCPVCGSKLSINLFDFFGGNAGRYNRFEDNPENKGKEGAI